MEEGLIKKLMAAIKCSSCGQRYETCDIDVIGHNDDTWFLKVRCSSCHAQSLVAAMIKETQLPKAATDLTEAEMKKLAKPGLVSGDDLLDAHEFLSNFDGDFSRLFGQE